jgi:putative ABC transport system substrate-binding protein
MAVAGDRPTRRAFLRAGLGGVSLLLACDRLPGQPPPAPPVPRIGYLEMAPNPIEAAWDEAFRQGLHDLGYVEGQNVAVEWKAASSGEQLTELAVDLVRLPVELIVVRGDAVARAVTAASPTMPVVVALTADPIATGLVTSLARPGGQVTGLSATAPQLTGKRLELLTEAAPQITRVAIFWNPSEPPRQAEFREAEAAARALGLQLQSLEVRGPADFDAAFAAALVERADGLLVFAGQLIVSQDERIVAFAKHHRLPAMYVQRVQVEAGGLMAYGPSQLAMHRRAAYFVDRILKGTKPGELPVEQPTTFDFIVNLQTAQALGLTIPQHVLLQATEVIQ